ncbi:unnamed protein product [Chrysodeixis includens]|uniref:Major facilitator superfamily (MFS) profile domain-containing protein n=1 Tax=Chrysodeixis includens TaxID=689277 RepID=A0A9P0C191_CHRIL|nr:unnamed protein product [Chrysodeixis includens]
MTKLNLLGEIAPKFAESAHIYRQFLGTFASSLLSLSGGLTFGFTAVLLPQLENDPYYPYDKAYDSWIASISPLAMVMGCLFSGSMSDGLGRRTGQILLVIPFTIGWIIMGFANGNTGMLVGRFITGISTGAIRPNSIVYIGEITDPKYRAIGLFGPTLLLHIGSLMCHTVGKYVYWKTSCFIFALPNLLCVAILLCLMESPLWLLSKGKIDDGIKSFKLFRGNGEAAEKELAKVLEKTKDKGEISAFKESVKLISSKPFIKSLAMIFLLFVAVQWCGINTLTYYAQIIFEKTFAGDIDAYMLMLSTDGLRIMTAVGMCLIAKIIPRKTFFVSSCFVASVVLVILVVYLYLKPEGMVWIAVTCIVLYIAVASALTSIAWTFVAEVFPSKVRGYGSSISSGISFALLFISVKASPEIMFSFGEQAMYASFAVSTFISGIILYFIIPDTNGKSLQDIENEMYKKESDKKTSASPPV